MEGDVPTWCSSTVPEHDSEGGEGRGWGEGALTVNTLSSKYSHKISGPVLVAGYKLSTLFSGTTRWSLGLLRTQ